MKRARKLLEDIKAFWSWNDGDKRWEHGSHRGYYFKPSLTGGKHRIYRKSTGKMIGTYLDGEEAMKKTHKWKRDRRKEFLKSIDIT